MKPAEIINFGCRLNIAEAAVAHAAAPAGSIVVNSCAVTAEAVRQALNVGPVVLCDKTMRGSAAEAEFVFERIAIVLESGHSLREAESTALTQLCQSRSIPRTP